MGTVTHSSRLRYVNSWDHQDVENISTPKDKQEYVVQYTWTDGSGDNQAQDQFRVQSTLATREEDNYDLAAGVADVFGNTLTFATVKELTLYNKSAVDGDNLLIGGQGPATTGNLWTDLFDGDSDGGIKVKAGGVLIVVAPFTGYSVSGGSTDIIRVYNDGIGGSGITYDLIVKGTRA